MLMKIDENLKKLREERKMTQQDLANAIGVDRSLIAQVERGSRLPSIPIGKKIADYFGISLDELISEQV